MKNLSNYSDAVWFQNRPKIPFIIIFYAHSNNVKYAIRMEHKKIEIILMNFHVSFMASLMDRKCEKPSKNEYWT